MHLRNRSIALGALLALIAVMVPFTGASAQATGYTVYGATEAPEEYDNIPVEVQRFFPSKLTVHQGDNVTFTGDFITATMLPANTDADEWLEDNADDIGEPFNSFALDPDDGAGTLKFNNSIVFADPTCGTADAPCTYDGSTVENSGLMAFGTGSWVAEVTADPGDVIWVVDLFAQQKRMRIEVVEDTVDASDQTAIDANRDTQLAQLLDSAEAMHNRLLSRRTSHREGGVRVFDAWVGFDHEDYALLGMYPRMLNLRAGQRVRYHFDQIEHQIHTATFGFPRTTEVASEVFIFQCDPDGDSGPGPDTAPTLEAPPFCADPTQLEVDFPVEVAIASGDGRVTSRSDFQNSAARGDQLPSNAPMNVRFPKPSGDKAFKYICLIHPFMRGKVKVRR